MEKTAVPGADRSSEPFRWRLFGLLVALLIVGYVAIIPYSLTLEAGALKTLTSRLPLPLLIAAQTLQGIVAYSILAGIGLFAAGRIGLGAPIFRKWIEGQPVKDDIRRIVRPALLVGLVGSLIVLAIEVLIFTPLLSQELAKTGISMPATLNPPAWQGLLASLYGPFDEEILMRLFLLTVLAWLGSRIWKSDSRRPRGAVLWTANILASVLFGLGHLPATAAAGLPIDPLVISRAVVLNGLLGVGFGWLYFTDGLESAMLAHFSADIVLHVIVPLLAIL
jgi:membrane protease YdiL (CAAX protease family)